MLKIILSPAKKMIDDPDSLETTGLPHFLDKTRELLDILKSMDYTVLKKLWQCNDEIARLNFSRLERMNLKTNLTPAVLAYDGIRFKYMAPSVFDVEQMRYIDSHLYILSGFYGAVKPYWGLTPYRLEMQAKLKGEGFKNLYEFWGDEIYKYLYSPGDIVVNLASYEYSQLITKYAPKERVINCVFADLKDGKIIEKGTKCKMARGEMTRFMAENFIENPEDLKAFNRLNYSYNRQLSDRNNYVFIQTLNNK